MATIRLRCDVKPLVVMEGAVSWAAMESSTRIPPIKLDKRPARATCEAAVELRCGREPSGYIGAVLVVRCAAMLERCAGLEQRCGWNVAAMKCWAVLLLRWCAGAAVRCGNAAAMHYDGSAM